METPASPSEVVPVPEETYQSWSSDRKRNAVEAALNFDDYVPQDTQTPAPSEAAAYNPALDAYRATHTWTDEGWKPVDGTTILRTAPEYLPTDTAFAELTDRRLVEIGAGDGYWAHTITHNSGDVVATDLTPPRVSTPAATPLTERTVLDTAVDSSTPRKVAYETLWTDVYQYSHRAVRDFATRDVLLVHPPGEVWVEDLLSLIRPEQALIFVGEWYPGPDATPVFFDRLNTAWELAATFPVYDWASMHARGYVFTQGQTDP